MTTSTVTNKIIDTANFKHLAIAEDDVDSIQFTIPKTYDGNDLSAGTVYSLWTIPGGSGDMTELTTTVSGDNILSVWPLSGAVVSKKGMVEFQLVILVGTTIVWKSFTAHFYVDRKLNPTDLDFTADVLTAHLTSVIAARDRAETAADTAEGVLEDTGFVAVAEDLALGASSNIKIVAANKTNIDLVAAAKSDIDALAPRASDMQTLAPQAASIGTLAPVASAIAALDAIKAAISALDLIKTDITGVNGAKTDVSAVAAKLTELQAVYAKLAAIEALYAKTTEIDALYAEIDQIGAKATVELVDTNRLYSDSQYLALKAQADAQALEIQASRAELYNGYKILQFGSTDIIGKGTKADYSAIDVSANVVDGSLELEQKGLTIRNIVNGASIANLGTVTFSTILNDKYYDTLNNAILTGTGSDMTATNNSGATANMGIYHLNAHGLASITDTTILAKLLPYVDGTKNVGKMGMRVVGKQQFNKDNTALQIQPLYPPSSAVAILSASNVLTILHPCLPSTVYTISKQSGNRLRVATVGSYPVVNTPILNQVNNNVAGVQSATITTHANARYLVIMLNDGADTSGLYTSILAGIQIEYGSSATTLEPYQEQLTFLPAVGNSLPNGVADSIKTVADGWEHSKRVSTPASVGSGVAVNTTNYPTAKNTGQWVNELTAGGTEIGVVGTDSTTGAGMLRFELATPITTHYDLPHLTSGKTIHRFAGEEKIALYGTGLTFSENVLTVLSAIKFVSGEMTDITDDATITDDTVTFSGVSATDVVYVKVEHDVDRPLGILEHTPTVSNTASRLAALEAAVFGG